MEHEDDCLAQFFTPEALLLLESINDLDSQQPTGQLGSASTVPINPSQQNGQQVSHKRESDDRSSNGLEPSPSSVQNGTATTAKRASLDPKRRAEVAELRKKGICFRCKVSKVRGGCSTVLPCQACIRSQAATTGRKSFRHWMQCVAFAFGDADLFATDLPCTEEKYLSILRSDDCIMAHDLEFAFESLIHWDISTISTDIATCLSNFPAAAMSESGVGILACSTLQRLVSPYVKDSMSKHARLLVEISLALRNNGKVARYAGYTTEELRHLRSFAGTRAIQGLEAALRNPFDNSLLGDQGRALFLTLFSVIVAVANYSLKPVSPLGPDQPTSAVEGPIAIQKQLLRILAHHMIYIAYRVNLLPPNIAKERLVQDTAFELGRNLRVQWIEVPDLDTSPAMPPHQYTNPNNSAPAKRPRQAILMYDEDKLLSPEICRKCRRTKRWINLKDGICLECRLEALSVGLPSHLLSLNKIMRLQDRAAYSISDDDIPSHMSPRSLEPSNEDIDPPEPANG